MFNNGSNAADGDPWQQLSGRASRLRVPRQGPLTRDGPLGRYRPAPEVIEHMLDDLEDRMRNYFVLYNREREMRKEVEGTAYRLEKELLSERNKVAESQSVINQLETKIKALIGQPLKIRETIEKIEVLYNQMDTLVQAFVGIGSCATLQSQNRTVFLRLFLEYLYPCRDLDVRLNTLYTAMYASLSSTGAITEQIPLPLPEPVAPVQPPTSVPSLPLRGLNIMVHQLMLKMEGSIQEPGWYSCVFRYDHEGEGSMDTNPSRVLKVTARPLDSASGIIEFNDCVEVHQLPPRVPNVIPKLIWDVYAGKDLVGSASVSIVDPKTLNHRDPWNIVDAQGKHRGDLIVTVRAIPEGSKLPAVGFARRNDELQTSSATPKDSDKDSKFVPTVPDAKATPTASGTSATSQATERATKTPVVGKGPPRFIPPPASTPPKGTPDEPFQPKQKAAFRKPLFLKSKAMAKPVPPGSDEKAGASTSDPPSADPKPNEAQAKPSPPAKAPATSSPVPSGQPKAQSPTVEAKKASIIPPKLTLPKEASPKMPLKAPVITKSEAVPAAKIPPKAVPKVASAEPKATLKSPTPAEPSVTKSLPVVTKAPSKAGIAPKTTSPVPTAKEGIVAKGVDTPASTGSGVTPKVAPKVAGSAGAKAPGILPKSSPPEAGEITPKSQMIVPKTKVLGLAPKVAMPPVAAKTPPSSTGSATPTATEEKKPLLPIVVKPKLLLKKPLMPKKA
ncbi:hypothetical protein BBOV_III006600 [Babesia bovis T2Bo]|uniref:Uncharacterized protein n=1 Tax=Babesia bovis TaxID=5865 RepID=A7ANT7_BABBO|nr:hypothetical protein BBOV_III006600 [Babesia bovis T2Bo]EDO08221.1 hypothetical protein BBOV_III006600 [Babesia bovis T2Bo]|eukprot:XP_001611789.1 hypothetical protein [Babesia bovis T2Bo]